MTSTDKEDPWLRVGRAVRARRGTRTQQEVAAQAEIGTTALGELERGDRTNFTPRTLAKICAALDWSTDSIDRILRGEDPIETPDSVLSGASYRKAPDAGEELLTLLGELRGTLGRLEDAVRRAVAKDRPA